MKSARLFLVVFAFGSLAMAEEPVSLSFENLDDFRKTDGWSVVKTVTGDPLEKRWASLEAGSGILINGEKGKAGNLVTQAEFGDVEVDVEFMTPKGSNSGIYFQRCYEIQILDSFGKKDAELGVHDCGAIYERWDEKREPKGYEGTVPKSNASKAPGQWQNFHIVFRAPRFDAEGKKIENARFIKVVHNGQLIHDNVEVTGPTRGGNAKEVAKGPFTIQGDHGPVAFRKFTVKAATLK